MKYFVRRLYHEEKYGPFSSEDEARKFIEDRVKEDPYWDYDPPHIGNWDKYPDIEGMKRGES